MNATLEPSFTVAEREKFDKLSSFSFVHYWNSNGEARTMPDKLLLFKGNRIYENILVKLVEGDIKQTNGELFAVYLKLGHVNLLAKDFAKALSAYQKAYNLDADRFWRDPSAYFGLGLVYFHFRAFSIAAEAFNRLLFTYPSLSISVEVHARLGFIYKNLEKFDLALKHLNAALSDKAESSFLSKTELRFHIAHCYDCAGDLERAFHEYKTLSLDQSVSLSNTLHAQILRQLGWICYRRECTADIRHQKICEAEQYLIQSRELEPSCGKTYYYLGRCYGELPERAHDAFTNYRQSIDKSEADADTWCSIGVLYQQQSQPMDALQAFICAVQLDSEHSAAWSDLGRLYEVNGQFSDALHCFKKAIKYRPAAPEALKARIRVLEKELHPSSLLIGNIRSLQPNKLPGLEEAWRLPIPAELSQRQEEFLKLKQQRYRDGSPLLAMSSILRAKMTNDQSATQIELLKVLRSNKANLMERDRNLLEQLERRYGDQEEAMVGVEQRLHSNSLPLVSQDDLMNVLGGTGTTVKNETTSSHDDATASTSASGNAIPKQEPIDGHDRNSLQEEAVSSTSDLPYSFSLTAAVHVPITITAEELIDRCHKRIEKPSEFTEIFDEKVPPPVPPETPSEKIPPEKALRQTPVIIVDSRKDAHGIELQNFCYNSTIALIRGMTTTLKMDLSLFSTKSLLEVAPDHEVEIRTQYRMPTDQNVDHLGNLTWACHSVRSFTTIAKYAQYQAQSFQYSLKEEAEKLRAAGAKYGGGSCDSTTVSSKRRRVAPFDESPMPMKMLKFGTNVDLSDENKFRAQLLELNKMPAFCRLVAGCNMLTHLGHSVYGMNTVQLYMKVPGARTPGHQENNGLASVNINIGPGECEWFGVPYEYWPVIDDMLRKRGLDFLKGVWWPDIDDLLEAGVPVHRFTQKAGDLVWVGSGCVHWVQSTGWCNNVAWNVGPLTALQLQVAIFSHEWNKLHGYKSLVPLQHLCWQLARNIRFSNQKIYVIIKQMLIRSLAYCKMVADMVTAAGKSIKVHPRQKGEVSHYCSTCEIEVWNLLLVREMNGKFPVYCVQCARKADLVNFLVLQQYSFDELSSVFDHFRLYPKSKSMGDHIKNWLYGWLGKNRLGAPIYNITQTNCDGARFVCELIVAGHCHRSIGRAMSKKDATAKAANDFVNFLIAEKLINASDLPAAIVPPPQASTSEVVLEESSREDNECVEVNAIAGQQNERTASVPDTEPDAENCKEELMQSANVDICGDVDGGWTIGNSKQCLNVFLQKIKKPPFDYIVHEVCTQKSRMFVAEGVLFLPELQCKFTAHGEGSTKKLAESYCALSILNQLFNNNLIGPYESSKRTGANKLEEIAVTISANLSTRIEEYLASSGVSEVADLSSASLMDPISLLVYQQLDQFSAAVPEVEKMVSWSPPLQNWNPWMATHINKVPLSYMTLGSISAKLFDEETLHYLPENIRMQREALPVFKYRDAILDMIAENAVTLIKGETGCGKSTQVCQYLLEEFLLRNEGAKFAAIVTQPRRISAITLAERVAEERGEILGKSIGYNVRFDAIYPRPYGSVMFMTVGVLLRRLESGLRGITHIIIDEIHERDINTDFVLIVLREMVRQYPDIRVVLMSASIDTTLFTNYFGECPIIQLKGRTFSVQHFFLEDIVQEIGFMPADIEEKTKMNEVVDAVDEITEEKENANLMVSEEYDVETKLASTQMLEDDIPLDVIEAILKKIDDRGEDGAVLIFLPGWSDISQAMSFFSNHPIFGSKDRFVILPLHSHLSSKEQHLVFESVSPNQRKIILSTNIAETSVTINDVVYVIDSCRVKEKTYTSRNNMVHYATVWASKTNLQQRRGRAGRVRNGFCYHLCSKLKYETLEECRQAEMLRTPLHTIALAVKLLHLGDIGDFLAKAVEPPPKEAVIEADLLLRELSALDSNGELTELGEILARLPVDPILGKMLVVATILGVGDLMSTLIAALSFNSPFIPHDRTDSKLTVEQRSFSGKRFSDHIALICVFNQWRDACADGVRCERDFCERYSLNRMVLISIRNVKQQLIHELVNECRFPESLFAEIPISNTKPDANVDLIISLLVYGLYPNVCYFRNGRRVFTLELATALINKQSISVPIDGSEVFIFPSRLFIFSEKLQSKVISCKQLSNITPLQLLLFGSQRVECHGLDCVKLDDMIPLKMDAHIAARIMALRPCIEAFIVRSCLHPERAGSMSDQDRKLVEILKEISSPTGWSMEGFREHYNVETNLLSTRQQVEPQICEWEALDDKGSASLMAEQCREWAMFDSNVNDVTPTHSVSNITRSDLHAQHLCGANEGEVIAEEILKEMHERRSYSLSEEGMHMTKLMNDSAKMRPSNSRTTSVISYGIENVRRCSGFGRGHIPATAL